MQNYDLAYWKEQYENENGQRKYWAGKAKEYLETIKTAESSISNLRFVNEGQEKMIKDKNDEIAKLKEELAKAPDMSAMMQETLQQMQDIIKKSSADAEENKENKEGKEGKEEG